MKKIIDKLTKLHNLEGNELVELLLCNNRDDMDYLHQQACQIRKKYYGNKVYIRGLIEFTNYCKNDCFYCGIRKSNTNVLRYRLTEETILKCCANGYAHGFRTFVLQGGEDFYWSDEKLVPLIAAIKKSFGDCAITLSIGERNHSSYEKLFAAGCDRYLLRHETADTFHYSKLHPSNLSLENRMSCLDDLKSIGFQTGCGFMIGSPFQTIDNIASDLKFIKRFQPDMVGIGPFLPAGGTPFSKYPPGTPEMTLKVLSIVRLLMPKVLLPATTALSTACMEGHKQGILSGANVIMPNISPAEVREKYNLYDNKVSTGIQAGESIKLLKRSMDTIGYKVVTDRGDALI